MLFPRSQMFHRSGNAFLQRSGTLRAAVSFWDRDLRRGQAAEGMAGKRFLMIFGPEYDMLCGYGHGTAAGR